MIIAICRCDPRPLHPSTSSWGKTLRLETTSPGSRCRSGRLCDFLLIWHCNNDSPGHHVPFLLGGWSVAYLQVQWGKKLISFNRSLPESDICETFRNTWESLWRPSWRTPSKIVSCQIPSTPSQNRYDFGIMAFGVLPSLYSCWNALQTQNILPVSKGCKEASQQEKFGDEFDIIGQLRLLSLKLHSCSLCLSFWY